VTALRDVIIPALREMNVLSGPEEVVGIGNRIVHGGRLYTRSEELTPAIRQAIQDLYRLAPLHNPPNYAAIQAEDTIFPEAFKAAIFDTAFHRTMPEEAFTLPVPYQWLEKYGIMKYGFHGTSHLYVSRVAAVLMGADPKDVNIITVHIGNGTSLAAVQRGMCVDTTMSVTPNNGPFMGTRSGSSFGPSEALFMIGKMIEEIERENSGQLLSLANVGKVIADADSILQKQSGYFGICGYSDRRDVEKAAAAGEERAELARKMEARHLIESIGSFFAVLDRVDAVVFTAGAGENDWDLRARILRAINPQLGLTIDERMNHFAVGGKYPAQISQKGAPVKVFVIPTDEELVMKCDTEALMNGTYDVHTNFRYPFDEPGWARLEWPQN
jgi:acetate kinase